MVQIGEDLKVISIPLSTDIANPHIHTKYLLSKSITTNATRLKPEGKDSMKLIYDKHDQEEDDNNNNSDNTEEDKNVILEGTIAIDTYTIRWGDGSSWSKQGVCMEDEEDDIQQVRKNSDENKPANYNKDYEQELSALKSQLEILKEKEKMAKWQSQATMVY